jgi:hypothetical protein
LLQILCRTTIAPLVARMARLGVKGGTFAALWRRIGDASTETLRPRKGWLLTLLAGCCAANLMAG